MGSISVKRIGAFIVVNLFAGVSSLVMAEPEKSQNLSPRVTAPLTKPGAAAAVTPLPRSATPGGKTLDPGAASRIGKVAPRVPQVIGTPSGNAVQVLHKAGYKPKEVYLEEPDPNLRYGYVRATSPAVGTFLEPGNIVELHIPRASPRLGIGALGISDVGRRAGFDLDQGRYEEIYRGADILLRKYDHQATFDKNTGQKYYSGGGIYIEPSDGAVIKLVDASHVPDGPGGVGSYNYFVLCNSAFRNNLAPAAKIFIGDYYMSWKPGATTTICVHTSQKQLSVVQFRGGDNSGYASDYKFHHAIFPPQAVAMQQQIRK